MRYPRPLDASSSVLAYFGAELRRLRTASDLTQEQLGIAVNYTASLVGMVETAKRSPTRDFADRCDEVLKADGALSRLWPLVNRDKVPAWFRGYVDLEEAATDIRSFQIQVVPGLLQTEDYARALITAGRLENVEELVAARMGRQALLERPSAPTLWFVLDENVLRRAIGGSAVMRAQLEHLALAADNPCIVVQVLPYSVGAHASLDGPLTILSFPDSPDVAYVDGHAKGHFITGPEDVRRCVRTYDLLRAVSLAPEESISLIRKAIEEHSTP